MKIKLNNMIFYGFHGVYPEERKLGQRFIVNLCIYTNDSNDINIKDLADTVDYTKIYDEVKQIMEVQQFHLLEDCANTIITNILKDFSLVSGVKVIIEKPGVPINASLSSVAIEMERFKK
ncbi:MAG: dihydroneopterin aldolase [Candidatus Cloacimonetes bacterium]|nr:dihydroneopterin aldolase [Candidatus Cloacimonadota bacterium]